MVTMILQIHSMYIIFSHFFNSSNRSPDHMFQFHGSRLSQGLIIAISFIFLGCFESNEAPFQHPHPSCSNMPSSISSPFHVPCMIVIPAHPPLPFSLYTTTCTSSLLVLAQPCMATSYQYPRHLQAHLSFSLSLLELPLWPPRTR